MSFLRISPFGRVGARKTHRADINSTSQPSLSLHVPAFGGMIMKPVSLLPGSITEDTVLAGQIEVDLSGVHKSGMVCGGLSVWLEGRWTDLEGSREKGTIVCYKQLAVVETGRETEIWLQPGTQRYKFTISLPSTLPRNGASPSGRLLYWLVGVIEGSPIAQVTSSLSSLPTSANTNDITSSVSYDSPPIDSKLNTSDLPLYGDMDKQDRSVPRMQGSVRTERRIAVSHNPNPNGGINRLDDELVHELPGFGTIRIQVRVNEWCIRCYFPMRINCIALSPAATLFAIRVRIAATTITTPPSTGIPVTTRQSFVVLELGKIPFSASGHPPAEFPSLWRGPAAGGNSWGDYKADGTGKLPACDQLRPSELPGMCMPEMAVPIRSSHQIVYEVFFSVHGEMADGSPMRNPSQGGLRVMRRAIDVVLPQCVLVSEILDLPSYSTTFGENIRRTDEYIYHRIEANLPCPTCQVIPLHNLCTVCPRDAVPHVQHAKPKPPALLMEGKNAKTGSSTVTFDPSYESCPSCSGKSILPGEDPNYHLCGCEIEGREAAYRVIWDEDQIVVDKGDAT